MGNCIDYGYSHDDGVCQDQSYWMRRTDGNRKLSQLSIPGTHDTMSLGWGGDIAQTQSKGLRNQLNSGIRFLDIRLGAFPNSNDPLRLYHGFVYLNSSFGNVLDTVTKFLAETYQQEAVLMRVKQENTNESDATFINLLNRFTSDPKYSGFIYNYTGNINPSLNEMRGKIVILQNFGGEQRWLPYSATFNIQDSYNLNNNWDLYNKWEKVKAQLNDASRSYRSGGSKAYMNYLSASGGSFPYFVVSGQSSPGTDAPLLSTGLTEPGFKWRYPDFPRINRFGIFATIAFQGTNKLTHSFINNNNGLGYVGIVVTDFPGQGLINSIINLNGLSRFTTR